MFDINNILDELNDCDNFCLLDFFMVTKNTETK